jgi:isopentenyldiphosphate isomerase
VLLLMRSATRAWDLDLQQQPLQQRRPPWHHPLLERVWKQRVAQHPLQYQQQQQHQQRCKQQET